MNQGLGSLVHWNEETIRQRAEKLAGAGVERVGGAQARPHGTRSLQAAGCSAGYTIDDHPFLATGLMRDLFEAFRKQVLALDPCVSKEFLKLYVAYKAETNFVDVVPQARRLRLSLNVAFHEIDDPRGICKDVTGVGRWGNGDIRSQPVVH